jgi:hypothetical protein
MALSSSTVLITVTLILTLLLTVYRWQYIRPLLTFAYASFFKPISSAGDNQQRALESFYHAQVDFPITYSP